MSIQTVLYAVFGGVGWVSGALAGSAATNGGVASKLVNDLFVNVSSIAYWLMLGVGLGVVLLLRSAPDGLAALSAAAGPALRQRLPPRPQGLARRRFVQKQAGSQTPHRRALKRLDVQHLTVRFGGIVAVDDVSFSVEPGEVVGMMGPNGAGKTTIVDVITGFTAADGGSVLLGDEPLGNWSPERRARGGMARSWQAVELFDEMTVRENLLVAADDHSVWTYAADLVRPNRPQRTDLLQEAALELGIQAHLDVRPSQLSQGTSRLVGIARAVVRDPAILLLDEPAAGLDGAETAELGEVIRNLASKRGIGVVLIEHDVQLLMSVCSRIVVLDFGKKIADGTPEEISLDPDVMRAYLGEEDLTADLRAGQGGAELGPSR
jgi:ABC-type branched-subunit amino acid transport system ATPase component